MNASPLVSVVIPTYNRWELVWEAIESVFGQTYPNWEAVVVNDGGEPPHGRAEAVLKDKRVIYVEHPENRGLASARNTGIACGTGEFIAYLDDDDVYYPRHIESLVGEILRNRWDVAYADAYRAACHASGARVEVTERRLEFSRDFDPVEFWKANFIPVLCVVHRRECLGNTGLFDTGLPVLEDWDLWLRMSTHFGFHHIPEITSEYRVRQDGTNMTERENRRIAPEVMARIYRKYLDDPVVSENRMLKECLLGGVTSLVGDCRRWFFLQWVEGTGNSSFQRLYETLPRVEKIRLLAYQPGYALRDWIRRTTRAE